MSKASTTRTIKFIAKAGTYTALIMCPDGGLYQEWEGTEKEVTKITPNFAQTTPKLNFVCTSSRVAEGVATPDSMQYYFNGTKIEFSGDTSTGIFAGYFKKFAPSGDNIYYGLQIIKNIVELSGFAPATIKMVAAISYGTQNDNIQAVYTIPIQKATGTSYRVTIASPDNKGFVITEKGGTCQLKAIATQSGEVLTKELTYLWEKMGASGWQSVGSSSSTTQTLTVSGDDIDTYGEYRVTVYRAGTEIGKDIQGVMDASDPYEIDARPTPEDEAISEDESGNDSVTYTPWIVKRGTNTQAIKNAKFFFVVKDAAGVYLNSDRTTAYSSYKVTRKMCLQSGGDISVTITSQD